MAVLFFLLWIIFNGRVTLEIVLFGIAISVRSSDIPFRKTKESARIFPSLFSTAST